MILAVKKNPGKFVMLKDRLLRGAIMAEGLRPAKEPQKVWGKMVQTPGYWHFLALNISNLFNNFQRLIEKRTTLDAMLLKSKSDI